jgi:hypothetical protein
MTLNQAFGLERPRPGRRAIAIKRQIEIAAEVLRGMLNGRNLEVAAREAGVFCGIGATQARKYWASNKGNAIRSIRCERPLDKYPWTKKEAQRLEKLIGPRNRALKQFCEREDAPVNYNK